MLRVSRPAAFVTAAVVGLSLLTGAAASASSSGSSGQHRHHNDHPDQLLEAPIQGSLVTDPPLFGVNPGGAPWVIRRGEAELDANGQLEVDVRGLIIPTTGVNPVALLAASVVCNGAVVATTATVPFDTNGNAKIKATVKLPVRCLAPAVLLNPNGNAATYIGVTGH
jgi:hypothetical protein